MTMDPITVGVDATVEAAEQLLAAYRISGLPVVDGAGQLVGVLSRTDLLLEGGPGLTQLLRGRASGLRVGELMSSPPVTVSLSTTLDEAARVMREERVHRLVVVNEQDAPIWGPERDGLRDVDRGRLGEISQGEWTMLMVPAPYETLERKVRNRVRDDESHRRVAAVLTDVAVDAIHPARHLGVSCSASSAMLEGPIESATHAAVETLIARLEALVETLPRQAVEELAFEQQLAELGLE